MGRLFKLGGHVVKSRRQRGNFIAARHLDPCAQLAARNRARRFPHRADFVSYRHREKITKGDRNTGGKDNQDGGKRAVMRLNKHAPSRHHDVEQSEQTRKQIAAQQGRGQTAGALEPAQIISAEANQYRDEGRDAKQQRHGPKFG